MTSPLPLVRTIFDNLTTAVLVFDAQLRVQTINTAAENLLSTSVRKTQGQTPAEVLPLAPQFAEAVARALDSDHAFTEWGMELQLVDGKNLVVDCMITPLVDSNETRSSRVIVELVSTHMHSRIVREENLQSLHDTARESMRAVAHEVKNPLGGLRGAAQLLERELDDDGLKEYTRIIISEADRLRNLVDRMLGPNSKPYFEQLNIHEVLEYICSLMEAETDGAFTVERVYDPSLPEVSADREKLIQAILNIVRNAWQAAGPQGQVTLLTRPQRLFTIGQKVHKLVFRIEVIDDGPGIPPEIGAGAFYPLITGRADGTGLGLSIAQSLIHEHGGLIEYERRDGKTVFGISIPLE
ncbi:two-component system nitrogen regulation sensor histidine kinase GlnL [Methylohalomonas lacus]|uniref:Sensory histidine kinase/phosphatase NtrB n=1 Tax=Methylohalomonas lacus TaxID=398773 RepID=A0AAE3HLN9_9GAMM|nr:nitrogen regulation protein NR(II) [Methylohalomonas lacus]MCS3903406.1 two-component system nitrogen regulation sensor histidine kinase GlnL [Methylohalomonas lacus]